MRRRFCCRAFFRLCQKGFLSALRPRQLEERQLANFLGINGNGTEALL